MTRLKRYASLGDYSASDLKKELSIDASVRTMQRDLQRCDHLAYVKANKSPQLLQRHKSARVAWVERHLRDRIEVMQAGETRWTRDVFAQFGERD